MSVHPRQAIREAVAATLAGKTAAGARVFTTRRTPLRAVELPAVAVYTLDETSEYVDDAGALWRSLTLAVHAVIAITEKVDDALDAIALEVETALAANPKLSGTAVECVLGATEVDIAEDASPPVGAIRLSYDVRYLSAP